MKKRLILAISTTFVFVIAIVIAISSGMNITVGGGNGVFVESRDVGEYSCDIFSNRVELVSYHGMEPIVKVPDTIEGLPVTAIRQAFRESEIQQITLGKNITWIPEYAFTGCGSLNTVTMADSVVSIGDHAFEYCSSLKQCEIPRKVKSIGAYAFYNCSSLSAVRIPDGVKEIQDYSFYWCYALKSLEIPDSVTRIGDYAFYTISVTEIKLPDTLESLGIGAFYGCAKAQTLTIPSGLNTISDCVFESCGFTNLVIPDNILSIGDEAFRQCGNLTSVSIPDSVTSIGNCTFMHTGLKTVDLHPGITSIGYEAFEYTPWFEGLKDEFVVVGDGVLIKYNGSAQTIQVPETVKMISELSQTHINTPKTVSVVLPDSVTAIGELAFYGYQNLKNITLSKNLIRIGDEAFYGCVALTDVNIPDGLTQLGHSAFVDTPWLANQKSDFVVIANTLVQYNGSNINVVVPEGVKRIDNYAFFNRKDIESVILPEGTLEIGDLAFLDCWALTFVTMPESVRSIGKGAFFKCYSLQDTLTVPKQTAIGFYAFYGCREKLERLSPQPVNSHINFSDDEYNKILGTNKAHTLQNLGFSDPGIFDLTQEQLAQMFAPGENLDGAGLLELTEEQSNSLAKRGITSYEWITLGNLGYNYEDLLVISDREMNFIFPNTELVANLIRAGFTQEEAEYPYSNGYANYKAIIKAAMAKQ